MNDFENIISFENLYKAHRRARLSKRHKKEVILFENNLSENLWALHYDLKYGKYMVGGYHSFMIYDPKEREIQAIGYRDRVIQHSICDNYLMPLLNRKLIYDNCACRKDKGTSFAISRWRKFMTEYYKKNGNKGYFVKLDVKKYFPSINHEVLKNKLYRIVVDKRVLNLLYSIIDSYNFDTDKGLPMGNQTSQCFALLYLDEMDRLMKEKLKIRYYLRYMDDMLCIVENKEKAKECISRAKDVLTQNKLILNPKSQARSISNGIDFLGWRFVYNKNGGIIQSIKNASKKRILQKIRFNVYQRKVGKKGRNKLFQSKISYNGFLIKGNTFSVRKKINELFNEKIFQK